MMTRGETETINVEEVRKVIDGSDKTFITSLLLASGLRASKMGFEYVKSAIPIYKTFNGNMEIICEVLGRLYEIRKTAVGRDMRTAIFEASERGWFSNFNDMVGYEILSADAEKMKAKDYLAIMAQCAESQRIKNILLGENKD